MPGMNPRRLLEVRASAVAVVVAAEVRGVEHVEELDEQADPPRRRRARRTSSCAGRGRPSLSPRAALIETCSPVAGSIVAIVVGAASRVQVACRPSGCTGGRSPPGTPARAGCRTAARTRPSPRRGAARPGPSVPTRRPRTDRTSPAAARSPRRVAGRAAVRVRARERVVRLQRRARQAALEPERQRVVARTC